MERIGVLIVDDRPIFRAGARGMLADYEHINVVGEATAVGATFGALLTGARHPAAA
jgi:DNA-binding NarL/FixJ family response regulator